MTGARGQWRAGVPASSDLLAPGFDSLLAHMSVEQVRPKIELLQEGRAPDTLFVLLDGLVQLFTTSAAWPQTGHIS
jgi:hypothetical protein